jgi:glucose/arabinose dehydrogenase
MRKLALVVLVTAAAACTGGGGEPITTAPATSTTEESTTSTAGPVPSSSTSVPSSTAPSTTQAVARLEGLEYRLVEGSLPFPIQVVTRPADGATFLVTKDGRIWGMTASGVEDEPLLDIRLRVTNSGERGLLSMTWHPTDPARFFVHYSDTNGNTTVEEYSVGSDGTADLDGRLVLRVAQPAANHNGGSLLFGPDGYLYLALGDGGGGGDTFNNGQSTDDLLGSMSRIDVDEGDPYGIPADNPFADGGGSPEVWSIGLRNPWRVWFDGGLLYIADVGQGSYEEVNVVPDSEGGLNFGWPITEGLHCFEPRSGCDVDGIELPVIEVSHGDAGTCSITGGIVYRGSAIPELDGHYFYSDFCGGWLRSFLYADGQATEQADWTDQVGVPGSVSSFGVGGDGEMYVTTSDAVYQVVPVRG